MNYLGSLIIFQISRLYPQNSDQWVWRGVLGNSQEPVHLSSQFHIKNCEGSDILPYLQANKPTCHSFMDIGIRDKIPGSETKNFVILGTESSVIIGISSAVPFAPKSHSLMHLGSDIHLHMHWAVLQERGDKFRISLSYQNWRSLSKPNSGNFLSKESSDSSHLFLTRIS